MALACLVVPHEHLESQRFHSRNNFQKATKEGVLYSKFFKSNIVKIEDIHNADEIAAAMKGLLKAFQPSFEAVSEILPDFQPHGIME